MSSLPSSVVKTSAIVITVGLDSDANHLVSSITESAGLRFRLYISIERFLEAAAQNHVGCILIQCPDDVGQASTVLQRVMSAFAQMAVVLILKTCRTASAVELMRSGAFSIVEYPMEHDALQEIVQEACRLSAEVQSACEESNNARIRMQEATDKELEVLDLVMAGRKNKDIADELGITIRGVEDRRIRLMKKLQVESLAELVELAVVYRRAKRDERLSGRLVRRASQPRRSVRGIEVWESCADQSRLELKQSSYRDADAMADISKDLSFAIDEGLPGDVWRTRMPVFYRRLTSGPFRRTDAAAAAGLTTGVGIPIFCDGKIVSIVLLLLDGGESLKTGIEHWRVAASSNRYELFGGIYSNCEKLRRLSEHIVFPIGEGLPGIVAERQLPYIGTRFADDSNAVRGVAIAAEQLHSGLGLPLTDSGATSDDVLLLFNSDSTPLFRMIQVWKPSENGSSMTLISETVDGERSLQSRCGRSIPCDADSLFASLSKSRQPQVLSDLESLRILTSDNRPLMPSLAIAIPTYQQGRLAAISVLLD
jgi:FixJ family two-component response regulator